MDDLEKLLREQATLFEGGEERPHNGELSDPGYRFYETQAQLVNKLQHKLEDDSAAQTARRAMFTGLYLLSAPHIDEDVAEDLKQKLQAAQPESDE